MRRHGGTPPCGSYRFVHAGDLHLDGPLRGITAAPPSLRTALRDASLQAWNSLVELAVRREAAFVILAGSVFDAESPSVRSCVALWDGLQRLRSRAIDVFIALPAEEAAAARHLPLLTGGATLFATERMSTADVVRDGTCLAALHGTSGDAADVCARVEAVRPTGSSLGIGVLPAAPERELGGGAGARATEVLVNAGLDYWALGGSRVQSVLQQTPWIVCSGTPQGQGLETGELGPKGCVVVEVEDGRIGRAVPAALDHVRFVSLETDVSACADRTAIRRVLQHDLERLSAGDPDRIVVVEAVLCGRIVSGLVRDRLSLETELLADLRRECVPHPARVWWARVRDRTSRADRQRCAGSGDLCRILTEQSEALGAPLPQSRFLAHHFAPLLRQWDAETDLSGQREIVRAAAVVALDALNVTESVGVLETVLPQARLERPTSEPAVETASVPSRMTVLLARDSRNKARILDSLQRAGSPWFSHPAPANPDSSRPQRHTLWENVDGVRANGNGLLARHLAGPLIVHAQDVSRIAAFGAADIGSRLDMAGGPEGSAVTAIAALRATAATLLDGSGRGGRIAHLTARLRAIDERLRSASAAEAAERAQLEALLAAGGTLDLERERDQLLAEREYWQTLIGIQSWCQQLQQARRDADASARFAAVPLDTHARWAALVQRHDDATEALRRARSRLKELRSERDRLGGPGDRAVARAAADALRLHEEIPVYRSRLLELATTRARLSELERQLTRGLDRLGREPDVARLSALHLAPGRRDEVQRWHQRIRCTRGTSAAAERALASARQRVRDLSSELSDLLARETSDSDAEIDVRWRSLWRLRANLEEIWEVQSRAESAARSVRAREEALQELAAVKSRTPSSWLRRLLSVASAAAAVAALWTGVRRGGVDPVPLAGLAVMLALLQLGVHVSGRWARAREARCESSRARLRAEIAHLRRGRDDNWTRAAQLTDAIRAAGLRLALPDPVTPEAVESCEQELAAQLRTDGPTSHLTGLLLGLLAAEDAEEAHVAELARADADRLGVEHEWETWRAEAGVPGDVEVERMEEWLDELARCAATRSAHDAARDELMALERATAVWENAARRLLKRIGTAIAPELCGSALAAQLSTLAERVRHDEECRQRRASLSAELHEAERRLAEAEAALARARAARQDWLTSLGVDDEAGLRELMDGANRWGEAHHRGLGLQSAIDDALARLDSPAAARAELTSAATWRWDAALRASDARLGEIAERLDRVAERRAAQEQLAAARKAVHVSDLRLAREDVRAELTDLAREWKLRVLAAAVLETSVQEYTKTERRQLFRWASQILATLTSGRFTVVSQAAKPAELTLTDRTGLRVAVDAALDAGLLAQVHLSLLFGHVAQLASRGVSVPIVLDDALALLPVDDVGPLVLGIAAFARSHPVLYLTTSANPARILSAMPADVAVVESDPS